MGNDDYVVYGAFTYKKGKDAYLRNKRGISFIDVIHIARDEKDLIEIIANEKEKYKDQRIMVFFYNDYIWACPFIMHIINDDPVIELKTAYPSRKLLKKYYQEYIKCKSNFETKDLHNEL